MRGSPPVEDRHRRLDEPPADPDVPQLRGDRQRTEVGHTAPPDRQVRADELTVGPHPERRDVTGPEAGPEQVGVPEDVGPDERPERVPEDPVGFVQIGLGERAHLDVHPHRMSGAERARGADQPIRRRRRPGPRRPKISLGAPGMNLPSRCEAVADLPDARQQLPAQREPTRRPGSPARCTTSARDMCSAQSPRPLRGGRSARGSTAAVLRRGTGCRMRAFMPSHWGAALVAKGRSARRPRGCSVTRRAWLTSPPRLTAELRAARAGMQPWQGTPAVRTLGEQLAACGIGLG